jgi:hypothetical protein
VERAALLIGLAVGGGVAARGLIPVLSARLLRNPDSIKSELCRPETLAILLTENCLTVIPISARHRTRAGYHAVARSMPHFTPKIDRYERPSAKLRKDWYASFGSNLPDMPMPVHANPILYDSQTANNTEAGHSMLLTKLKAMPERIGLTELVDCAEAAYIETRPADFDFHKYQYLRNR